MNNVIKSNDDILQEYEDHVLDVAKPKSYRMTPLIITFCEAELTSIDIKTFLEMGLKIIRFKMTHITKSDKIGMLNMIKDAVKWCCDKYEVTTWPITISIDIPNACIRTGFLKEEIKEISVDVEEDWIVEITSDTKFWNKCDSKRIFIDDPYIIKDIKPGTEVTIHFGMIVMVCTEVVDDKTIRCKVLRGDKLKSLEFVCVRGVKHLKPPLSKIDLDLIAFAKEHKLDIITVNSVRWAKSLKIIRKMFDGEHVPLIMSTICEQEGLDNFDDIIENSDAIILAREFLAYEIKDKHKMITIQLNMGAKCRQHGKPFYISGNILERTLHKGTITGCDLTDITNTIMQGAGFVFRSYKDPANVLQAMKILDEIGKTVESMTASTDLWRMCDEFKVPVNAAEACILAGAMTAKQLESEAFVVTTVTGRTAIQLSHIAPEAVIMAISTDPFVARQLQIYRGIVPIVYDKLPLKDWYAEIEERIKFAVAYGLKRDILKYGQSYVELRRYSPTSAYCDTVKVWKVTTTEETKKRKYNYDKCDAY